MAAVCSVGAGSGQRMRVAPRSSRLRRQAKMRAASALGEFQAAQGSTRAGYRRCQSVGSMTPVFGGAAARAALRASGVDSVSRKVARGA